MVNSLKIISYNIEHGGHNIRTYRIKNYIDMINKYNPDIVCFQEIMRPDGDDTTLRISKLLKWFYVRNMYAGISIMSRYKIVKKHTDLNYTNVLGITVDVNGVLINVYNLHLHDQPGTPTTLKGVEYPGTPFITNERVAINMSFSTKHDDLRFLIKSIRNNPVKKTIIVGDFNEPSHLDTYVRWKCSLFLQRCGFIDSMRYLYKNAKQYPLLTYNTYNTEPYPMERIDLVYHRGLIPTGLKLIPNKGHSDHRPVLIAFRHI